MLQYDYVIVGAGMAADAAISGIRRRDPQGSVLVIGEEPFPPYQRPPLSKKLWLDMRLEEAFLNSWQRGRGVDWALHTRVVRLQPEQRQVQTDHEQVIGYGKLLLATGARPRRFADSPPSVFYVGSLREHVRLWSELAEPRSIVVVGGGFIGAEMAAVLSSRQHHVTWVMQEPYPFAGFFPDDLARHVQEEYRKHAVTILGHSDVRSISEESGEIHVVTQAGQNVTGELAVVGIGVTPNDDLAKTVGLSDGMGIEVDQYLRTANPHIWAAGDVAIMRPDLKAMMHEDHAVTQGRAAGENMAGAQKPYNHRSFYYSDLYHFGYEAIGECRTSHQVVEDWVVPHEEGVVYYLEDERVVGVLNWNVWDGIAKAQALIDGQRPVRTPDLIGHIRNAQS
ncbi:MAG: monodehydroascorbate reductase (NADH) [Sulfobacillus acidophilus]|uniref:Monodehydroascorbate reductase (NADH) n=1 Tax=Sulfobacillus acidophilus TaxID=53633 RepID=A0A2T2WKT9_9FIRM|nr:MAG: monodehydroascorbate reductase (NADH) [Sulfobacillus acidophilus]